MTGLKNQSLSHQSKTPKAVSERVQGGNRAGALDMEMKAPTPRAGVVPSVQRWSRQVGGPSARRHTWVFADLPPRRLLSRRHLLQLVSMFW